MGLRTYPDLVLLRHGQTAWNVEGRMQGRLDSPLTALGRAQAWRQARLLRNLPEMTAYASPAGRAQQTAEIAFAGRDVRLDPRLHEIDIGEFTGKTLSELAQAHPALFADGGLNWYDRAPGGEHFAGLRTRVRAFLEELDGPAVIVTHGITLRMLRLEAMGLPLARLHEMPVLQGALHLVCHGRHRMLI